MKAMVMRGKSLVVEEIAAPTPGPNQVLAKVLACGICGSDLHAAKYWDQMQAMAAVTGRNDGRDMNAGIVMGHEFVAEVVEAGAGAEAWAVGTRVTSVPVLQTSASPNGFFSIGYSPEIPGAYGEYVVMSAPFLLKVADNVSDELAATTEPCAVGLHAVREAKIEPRNTALVMGAGPIGLMTLLWLKKEGVRYVAVSDFSPERRALAEQLGADKVFDPKEVILAEALDAELKGLPAVEGGPASYGGAATTAAPDFVFECVGVNGTLQQAMELVQMRGTVVVVGVCMQPDTIMPMTGINKQVTLKFVLGYTFPEYAETLQAFADGALDPSALITRTVGLDELPDTFAALADPKDCKVLVIPGKR